MQAKQVFWLLGGHHEFHAGQAEIGPIASWMGALRVTNWLLCSKLSDRPWLVFSLGLRIPLICPPTTPACAWTLLVLAKEMFELLGGDPEFHVVQAEIGPIAG